MMPSDMNPTQMSGMLGDGVDLVAQSQDVIFQAYSRVVLPLDGYIFWSPTVTQVVAGALHYAQEIQQNEDETVGFATVTFTARRPVMLFETMPVNTIYVATVSNFRYSFSRQTGFFSEAGVWHYVGRMIYPAFASQLLDTQGTIDVNQAVVSNSLPMWLSLNGYNPTTLYPDWFSNPLTLYPSFCVPTNLEPPYGTVHIPEEFPQAIQAVPLLDAQRSSTQLVWDKVRVTLYGLQNNKAIDFLNMVLQYSENTDNFGLRNTPVVKDAKRKQEELQALAMKKTIDFEINYYQLRADQVARQLITSALPQLIINT
jgi:hypothetical protein